MREFRWPFIILVLLIVTCWYHWGWAGNYTHYVVVEPGGIAPDSALVEVRTLAGTVVDSNTLTSLPDSLSVTLDSTLPYESRTYFYWYGSGTRYHPEIAFVPILLVEATASLSDADIGAIADSTDSILSDAHGSGSWVGTIQGANRLAMFYFIDTSGTDDTVGPTTWNIEHSTGTPHISGISNGNGSDTASLVDGSWYVTVIPSTAYAWNPKTITVSANDTFDIYGYNIPTDSGSVADKTCAVTVNVKEFWGVGGAGHRFTVNPAKSNLRDSSGNFYPGVTAKSAVTDTAGQVTFTCIWSSYYSPDSVAYWLIGQSTGVSDIKKRFWVPRQVSYTLRD